MLGGAVPVVSYNQPEELLPFISAERSKFGLAFETCRADGMDRVAAIFRPMDALEPTAERAPRRLTEVGRCGISSTSTLGSVGKFLEGNFDAVKRLGKGSWRYRPSTGFRLGRVPPDSPCAGKSWFLLCPNFLVCGLRTWGR